MTELAIPKPILRYLRARVTHFFKGRGQEAVTEACEAVPGALPEATVMRLASGGPFGWLLDARLDRDEAGRRVLEVLENSRMAGPDHYEVHDDGTCHVLPNEQTMMVLPKDVSPARRAEIEQEYFAHNREVGALLRQRGFRGASPAFSAERRASPDR